MSDKQQCPNCNFGICTNEQYCDINIYNTNCMFIAKKSCYLVKVHGRIYNTITIFKSDKNIDRSHYFYTFGNKLNNAGYLSFNNTKYNINTNKYGHFEICVEIPTNYVDDHKRNNVLEFTIHNINKSQCIKFISNIINSQENTWSIISDIDDTIKDSNVLNKLELIQNTFYREFRPNKDMLHKFNELKTKYNIVNYHYVSASLWQLYEHLHDFVLKYYPDGTFYLRSVDIDNLDTLIDFVLSRTVEYKIDIISHIIEMDKTKKYILIGDDGEHDPEIYVALYNKYPEYVNLIIIRSVRLDQDDLLRRMNKVPLNKFEIIMGNAKTR